MAATTTALRPTVLAGHGEDGLIAWVLLALAALGTMLCLYLALVWAMASLILLAGPASRIGVALLGMLRVLAPQVARRIVVGAAVATTATGLVLVPATAASSDAEPDVGTSQRPIAVASDLIPAAPAEPEPEPGAAAPASSGNEDEDSAPLAPLGWGETPAPGGSSPETSGASGAEAPSAPADAPQDDTPPAPSPRTEPSGDPTAAPQSASTVVVRPGETLWSITDDLLSPTPDHPSEIATAWPLLHEANRDVIGTDPDLLEPGQVLTVPDSLSSQEQ
ncbi:LysM peptidoglycan-binding domain-containing protein [Brachybacterium sp. FME24]|uniref:LysM peptidoglycan-binding domain-containing protein n=1 Tax=Brachybacterium sp. FME24 TaxID=2742605 RepID=UPI001D01F798|nr:LysM peptidoglycan-binding domain-containing protein [Brachybacterium sp. FME24]